MLDQIINEQTNMRTIRLQGADIELQSIGLSLYAQLDKRRPNKKGTYPIRIRITHRRSYRDYGTRQVASLEEWEKVTLKRPKDRLADMKIKILALLERAFGIIKDIDPFSFEEFNDLYMNKRSNDRFNIINWYNDKITELKANDQIGTAITYECSRNSIQDFKGKDKRLTFEQITPDFLRKYEAWNYSQGNSAATVGIYLRPLRHLFNRAKKIVKDYPFDDYRIPAPRNIKKSLIKEQIKSIYEYSSSEDSITDFYRDIWLFSYFANGINMKDICRLKYDNIKGGFLEFRRAKTARTNRNNKPISIVLTDDLKKIIDIHGQGGNGYIFNFLEEGMSAEKEMAAVKQAMRQTNKYIRKITSELGIENDVTTYTARHSFATILKNAGVSPSFIGESLGHSSLKTTESYLGSFETDQRKENINKLKDW